MPENASSIEKLSAGTAIDMGNVALLPIERTVLCSHKIGKHTWFTAAKHPCALVVRDANGIRITDIGAESLTLDQLRDAIPDLDNLLARM